MSSVDVVAEVGPSVETLRSRALDSPLAPGDGGRIEYGRRSRKGGRCLPAAIIFLVIIAFPVYWMVLTAFKPTSEILTTTPQFLPLHATLGNFSYAIHQPYFWDYVKNTVIASGATVVVSLVIALLAALALARFAFSGRKLVLVLIIVIQMVPLTALVIPLFFELERLGLLNTMPGLVAAYVAFVLPFTIWILRGFVQSIPKDIEEAAMVDGCSRVAAFRRVLLPLIAPGLVATAIYAFIQAWNQYLFPLVIMTDQKNQPLTVWLASFATNRGIHYGALMAASTLFSVPIVLLFLAVQHRVVSGLTAGAVKG